jgi:hypothetical protein
VKKFRWNDECLEHALQQMPIIKDHRSKEEIYQQLIKARKTARQKAWFLPVLIPIVVAVFVMAIYAPSLPFTQRPEKSTGKLDQHLITLQAKQPAKESQMLLSKGEHDSFLSRIATKEALNDQDIVVVGIPDQQSQIIIPISVPVKKHEPAAEQLAMATSKIDEQKWGISKRLLDGVTIAPSRESNQVWFVRVPKQHPVFSEGPMGESLFLASIEETICWMGGKIVRFFTEKKEGMALHYRGYVKELEIPNKKRAYYLYWSGPTHPVFLVPSPQRVPTFLEALKQMKKDGNGPLRSAVPKEVGIKKVSVQNDLVVIEFTEDSKLNELPSVQWMVEAILLTAKEFGFRTVTFKGGGIKQIGPYMFGEKIAVPVGPNPIMSYASAQ